MKPRMKLVVIALLGLWVLLFAGCNQGAPPPGGGGGGGGGGNATAQDVGKVLTAANAQLYRVESPLSLAGLPVPVLGLTPFSVGLIPQDAASWSCTGVTVTGNARDPDGDGIPVDATYNGKCTWSDNGSNGSVTGYWEFNDLNIQDPDSGDPVAGVKVHGTIEWGLTSSDGSVTSTWEIDRHDFVKNGRTYDFDYQGTWTVTIENVGTYTTDYNLKGTWTPDDPEHPWYVGTINVEKGYGTFKGSGPTCTKGWSLDVTLTNVHDNGTKIDGGTATFSGTDCEGNSASFSVTWSPSQVCVTVGGHTSCGPN